MDHIVESLREASHHISGPAIIFSVLLFTLPVGVGLTVKATRLYQDSRARGKPPIVAILLGVVGISILGMAAAFVLTTL